MKDAEILQLVDAGMSYQAIAAERGFSVHSVRGRYSRARRLLNEGAAMERAKDTTAERQDAREGKDALLEELYDLRARVAQLERESVPPPPADDTPRLHNFLRELQARGTYGRFLAWYDWHIPDESRQALELGLQVERAVKPDFNLLGGDVFDFARLSRFEQPRGGSGRDVLAEVESAYLGYVTRLQAPAAFIAGNHDSPLDGRLDAALNVSPFHETAEERYVDMVRAGGRVWYLGGMTEVKLHSVIAEHGERHGASSFKAALGDLGYGVSRIGGHAHTPGLHIHRAEVEGDDNAYRVVMSATTGALCNLKPHYRRGKKNARRHLHSMAVVTFSLVHYVCNIEMVVFHREPDGSLVAFCGGQVLRQPPMTVLRGRR